MPFAASIRSNDILSEVNETAEQYGRPEWLDAGEWRELGTEVHTLYFRCEELNDQLPERFHEAVGKEEWRRALLIHMTYCHRPWLPLKELDLETFESNWKEGEVAEFIAKAKEWISEVEELLGSW